MLFLIFISKKPCEVLFLDSVIEDVRVRKILDSRGNPTVEVDIITWNGFVQAQVLEKSPHSQREEWIR